MLRFRASMRYARPRPVQMLLRIAYGTKAQADKQVEALRPATTTAEASEESAS